MPKCQHPDCEREADVMFGNGGFTEFKCMEHALAEDDTAPGVQQAAASEIN